jgi:predicted PurR-regulated permease PerM
MSRMVSFIVLLGVILIFGFWFYRVISSFILPMFLAVLLVVMFRPWHAVFLQWCRGQRHIAALLTTLSVLVVAILPALALILLVGWELFGRSASVSEVVAAAEHPAAINNSLRERLGELRNSLGLELPYVAELRFIESSIASMVQHAATGATYEGDPGSVEKLVQTLEHLRTQISTGAHASALPQLDALLETLNEPLEDPSIEPGSFAYLQMLNRTKSQYYALKKVLVGGAVRVWLTDLVNPTDEELRTWTEKITSIAPGVLRSVGGATGSFLGNLILNLVITVIALYFFLADGPGMIQTLMNLSPLDDAHERELIAEFDAVTRAVVLASLLAAVAQGILAGLAFWVISLIVPQFNMVFTLTLLTTVIALVPFVGAASVWLPTVVWLFFQQEYGAAIGLCIFGTAVISTADNIIKPLVLHGQSNLHPLFAFLSVLGGVQTLGPIGILVGPMVVAFLQILLNILHRELVASEVPQAQASQRERLPLILSLRERGLRLTSAPASRIRRV